MITRQPDPADRRMRHIVITEAGRRALARSREQLQVVGTGLLGPNSADQQASLRSTLPPLAMGAVQGGASCSSGQSDSARS